MGILKRLKAAYNVATGRFTQLDSDGFPVFNFPTNTGYAVGAETALYATAVFSCVNLLASVIASIPLKIYKEDAGGDVSEAKLNPLYWVLSQKPNGWQTAYDYWLYNVECMLLRGGFISWKNVVGAGKVSQLIPLHPDTITRRLSRDGRILFSGDALYGPDSYMHFNDEPQEKFFWANYRTLDGLNPCSPIQYAAESIGLAISAEAHGANFLRNDATPPHVLKFPSKLTPEIMKNTAAMWKAGGSGNNYGMPRMLDNGADIMKLSLSNVDAQYLETRRFQREDICGIFRVPPSMISDTQRAQGWSTLEQKNSDFLTYTLSPYLTNIEQAVNRSLIPEAQWGNVYPDFATKILMRSDIATRTAYYSSMYNVRALSPNEIRVEEGYNKRDGGDEYAKEAISTPKPPAAMEPKESKTIEDGEDDEAA